MAELIPVGRLQVATPTTMAQSIRAITVATDAVDERVELKSTGIIADLIAGNPAVVAAIAAAVAGISGLARYAKCVRRESGAWTWVGPDDPTATHYLIPDHTGALVVRATPTPVPLATPAIDW